MFILLKKKQFLRKKESLTYVSKMSKFKTGRVQKYTSLYSLKNYRVVDYKKSLGQLLYSNYLD